MNEEDKKFQIYYTIQFANALLTHIHKLQNNMHSIKDLETDKEKLDLVVIETFKNSDSIILLRYMMHEYYKQYISNGYTPYKIIQPYNWRFEIAIERKEDSKHTINYMAVVKLRTCITTSYNVTYLETYEDAQLFIEENDIGSVLRNYKI